MDEKEKLACNLKQANFAEISLKDAIENNADINSDDSEKDSEWGDLVIKEDLNASELEIENYKSDSENLISENVCIKKELDYDTKIESVAAEVQLNLDEPENAQVETGENNSGCKDDTYTVKSAASEPKLDVVINSSAKKISENYSNLKDTQNTLALVPYVKIYNQVPTSLKFSKIDATSSKINLRKCKYVIRLKNNNTIDSKVEEKKKTLCKFKQSANSIVTKKTSVNISQTSKSAKESLSENKELIAGSCNDKNKSLKTKKYVMKNYKTKKVFLEDELRQSPDLGCEISVNAMNKNSMIILNHSDDNSSDEAESVTKMQSVSEEFNDKKQDLIRWQLEEVSVPTFRGFVKPPDWLSCTLPENGYECSACGDRFFIKESLLEHKERKCMKIRFFCNKCNKTFIFYNKCKFKIHVNKHKLKDAKVYDDRIEIYSLRLRSGQSPHKKLLNEDKKKEKPVSPECEKSSPKKQDEAAKIEEKLDKEVAENKTDEAEDQTKTIDEFMGDSTNKNGVKCLACDDQFECRRKLMSHLKTDEEKISEFFTCAKCSMILPSQCALDAHAYTHSQSSSSVSMCPECGSRCSNPREFVYHLNACGHQYRRSGYFCNQCNVCVFKTVDDFVNHWVEKHCKKFFRCPDCVLSFQSLCPHWCEKKKGESKIKCMISCPVCPFLLEFASEHKKIIFTEVKKHLNTSHASFIKTVNYVFKSKFCANAFRSKDELRAHHDKEHKISNYYKISECSLHNKVISCQKNFFDNQLHNSAFISIAVSLTAEESKLADTYDVPLVSSVIENPQDSGQNYSGSPESAKETKIFNSVRKSASPEGKSVQNTCDKVNAADAEIGSKKRILQIAFPDHRNLCVKCGLVCSGLENINHKRKCKSLFRIRKCVACKIEVKGEHFVEHCRSHFADFYVCILCNGTPCRFRSLYKHIRTHVKRLSLPLFCPFCSYFMFDEQSAFTHLLKKHRKFRVSQSVSQCQSCNKIFSSRGNLVRHVKETHNSDHSYNRLQKDEDSVQSDDELQIVQDGIEADFLEEKKSLPEDEVHEIKLRNYCIHCSRTIDLKMHSKHLFDHLVSGLIICALCNGLEFSSNAMLIKHLEGHSTKLKYPFDCPICPNSVRLTEATSCAKHLKADHGFGDLKCEICSIKFNFNIELANHDDIVHKSSSFPFDKHGKGFICWICQAFETDKKVKLFPHFKIVHDIPTNKIIEKKMIKIRTCSHILKVLPKDKVTRKQRVADIKILEKSSVFNCNFKRLRSSNESEVVKRLRRFSPVKVSNSSEIKDEEIKKPIVVTFQGIKLKSPRVVLRRSFDFIPSTVKIKEEPTGVTIEGTSTTLKVKEEPTGVKIKTEPGTVKIEEEFGTNISSKSRRYSCKRCSFNTHDQSLYLRHRRKHKKRLRSKFVQESFVCDKCNESFVVRPSLIRHMFFVHKIKLNPLTGKAVVKLEPEDNFVKLEPEDNFDSRVENTTVPMLSTSNLSVESASNSSVKSASNSSIKSVSNSTAKTSDKNSRLNSSSTKKIKLQLKNQSVSKNSSNSLRVRIKRQKKTKKAPKMKNMKAPKIKSIKVPKMTNMKVPKIKIKKELINQESLGQMTANTVLENGTSNFENSEENSRLHTESAAPFRCSVCREGFETNMEMYRHLRTHGMAFLKIGRRLSHPTEGSNQPTSTVQ